MKGTRMWKQSCNRKSSLCKLSDCPNSTNSLFNADGRS